MVMLVKRTVKGTAYYYLEHTIRVGGKVTRKSKYLGKAVPDDIKKLEKDFLLELKRERWFEDFDSIRRNYAAETRATPPSSREKLLREFSVRFTYDTQRIEGSTLSLRQTSQLLEEGATPGGKPVADVKEAEAHQRVFLGMQGEKRDLSLRLVLDWHWEMFKHTKPDVAGQVRRHGVRIAGSRFIPPTPVELQPMLDDFFAWYRRSERSLHPVELAALAHLKFVTIHPFADGNGRMSRLMMNFVLRRAAYPMFNIEARDRTAYYNALERSQLKADDEVFARWLFRRYRKEFARYSVPHHS
jgi:Fic family protein